MKFRFLTGFLVLAVGGASVLGAPLADKLPGRAVAYAGWAGRNLTFDGSMLGQLLQEPAVAQAAGQAISEIVGQISPDSAAGLSALTKLAQIAWQRPMACAIYSADPITAETLPTAILLIDLGDQKDPFAAKLDELIEAISDKMVVTKESEGIITYRVIKLKGVTLFMGYSQQMFFVCTNPKLPDMLSQLAPAQSLEADEVFSTCYQAVTGENEQFAAYLDVSAAMDLIEKRNATAGLGEVTEIATKSSARSIVDALGLGKMTNVAASMQIRQRGIYSKTRLFSPGPHEGLLMSLSGATLSEADLAVIPADAIVAGAIKLAPISALDEARKVAEAIWPSSSMIIDAILASWTEHLGVSIENDLLGSLGDTWILASAPGFGGFATGTVMSVSIADEEKFAAALVKAEQAIVGAQTQPSQFDPQIQPQLSIATYKAGRVEIRYLIAPEYFQGITPAWCIHQGRFYLAGWPQILDSAIHSNEAQQLTGDPEFSRVSDMVSKAASAIIYVDDRALIRSLYPIALMAGAAVRSKAPRDNTNLYWPLALWKLEKYASGQITVASADATGLTFESFGSSPINSATGAGLITLSVLVPSLMEARQQDADTPEPIDTEPVE